MTFVLGTASEDRLIGIKPKLVCCVRYAIKRTAVDFSVFEGLRSEARQRELYLSGASRTLQSYHLTGEAVDLVPYVAGRLQWQMPLCIKVATVMPQASRDLSVRLVWGAVWDRELASLDPKRLAAEVEAYGVRFRAAHPPRVIDGELVQPEPLIDGAHFQLIREAA